MRIYYKQEAVTLGKRLSSGHDEGHGRYISPEKYFHVRMAICSRQLVNSFQESHRESKVIDEKEMGQPEVRGSGDDQGGRGLRLVVSP